MRCLTQFSIAARQIVRYYIFEEFFFDWPALLPANVTKEGGAEIEDIATGPQNTQLMTMLSQKNTNKQIKAKHLTDANAITNRKEKKKTLN